MSFEIAKAGWLYRLSSILKRWKKAWFVLYTDGLLKYFENPDVHTAEDAISIPQQCSNISSHVTGVQCPSGFSSSYLFCLEFRNGDKWTLCADSIDDSKAWEISLIDAKNVNMESNNFLWNDENLAYGINCPPPPYYPPPPYGLPASCPQNYYGQPAPANVYPPYMYPQHPGQTTTVIYADHPGYYRRHNDGGDLAMGVMAGAAIGSMMWGPLLWW